jgi:capsular polysaccharide biosynthesis protein
MNNKAENNFNIFSALKEKALAIFLIGLLISALVFIGSTFITPKYTAESKFLVVQNLYGNVDVYTATKSAERIAVSLIEVVHSEQFMNYVLEDTRINATHFRSEDDKGLKTWKNWTSARLSTGTGLIELKVYNPDDAQAKLISEAVINTLQEKGDLFHGAGDSVNIQYLEGPRVSDKPNKPNIWLNSIAGFLAGVTAGSVFVYLTSDADHDKFYYTNIVAKETPKKKKNDAEDPMNVIYGNDWKQNQLKA